MPQAASGFDADAPLGVFCGEVPGRVRMIIYAEQIICAGNGSGGISLTR
jgi:hypothetical protein